MKLDNVGINGDGGVIGAIGDDRLYISRQHPVPSMPSTSRKRRRVFIDPLRYHFAPFLN
jgi:hypothetical protein